MAEHFYCGSGKEKTFNDGGSLISVSLDLEMLNAMASKSGYISKAGKKFVQIKVSRRREEGKYGETHSVEIDTWQSQNKEELRKELMQKQTPFPEEKPFKSDIPF